MQANPFTNENYINIENALVFDGIDDYVNMFDNFTNPSDMGFSFFIKPYEIDGNIIFSHLNETSINVYLGYYFVLGTSIKGIDGYFNYGALSNISFLSNTDVINLNRWNHVAINYDVTNNRIQLYVNAKLIFNASSAPAIAQIPNPPKERMIGALPYDNPRTNKNFKGEMAHFLMVSKPFTIDDIYAILNHIGIVPKDLRNNVLAYLPLQKDNTIESKNDLPIMRENTVFKFEYFPIDVDTEPLPTLAPANVSKMFDSIRNFKLVSIANKPKFIYDTNYINFDTSNAKMEFSFDRTILAPYTFVLVYKESNPVSGRKIKLSINTDYTNGISWEFDSGDVDNAGDNLLGSNNTFFNIPKIASPNFQVVSLEFDGANSKMFVHDSAIAFASGSLANYNISENDIFRLGYDSGLGGQPIISEIMMFEGTLDSTSRTAIFDYLKNKYGI